MFSRPRSRDKGGNFSEKFRARANNFDHFLSSRRMYIYFDGRFSTIFPPFSFTLDFLLIQFRTTPKRFIVEQLENTGEILAGKVGSDSTRNSNITEISLGSFEEKFIAEHSPCTRLLDLSENYKSSNERVSFPSFPSLPRGERRVREHRFSNKNSQN